VTSPLPPALVEALKTLLSFHTNQIADGKVEVRWQMHVSDVNGDNQRRYAEAWQAVAAAVAPEQ
jgi:hypothetical protein